MVHTEGTIIRLRDVVLEMLYLYVAGKQNALDTIAEEFHTKNCLHWIGLSTATQRNEIYEDSIGSYGDLYTMTSKNIYTMAKDYGGRPSKWGRINFGIRRIKKLKLFVHWTQDLWRISEFPSI